MSKQKTVKEDGQQTKTKRTRSKQKKEEQPQQESNILQEVPPATPKASEKQNQKPLEKVKASFTYKSSISHFQKKVQEFTQEIKKYMEDILRDDTSAKDVQYKFY